MDNWNGHKGKLALEYLVAQCHKPVAKEKLMDALWPEAAPEFARRNLHQAIYSLRQTFKSVHPQTRPVLFRDECYLLNPAFQVWIDFVDFEAHLSVGQHFAETGQRCDAMREYGIAESLYRGEFLEDEPYEDWPVVKREMLKGLYLEIASQLSAYHAENGDFVSAIAQCHKILTHDNCDEAAYRRLMECYLAQGQRHLAMQQYDTCVRVLRETLDLPPSEEMESLFRKIAMA